jgi:hypothetical protein
VFAWGGSPGKFLGHGQQRVHRRLLTSWPGLLSERCMRKFKKGVINQEQEHEYNVQCMALEDMNWMIAI